VTETGAGRRTLPLRDWFLLPLIVIATTLVLVIGVDAGARAIWKEEAGKVCIDPKADRGLPECVGWTKSATGPWARVHYNECGYRATGSCRTRPSGAARMAVLGSSMSWGFLVPFDHVWSVVAAREVRARCGRTLDVQSLGGYGGLDAAVARLPEALTLDPQVVALVVTPLDLSEKIAAARAAPEKGKGGHDRGGAWSRKLLMIQGLLSMSRTKAVVQDYMYRDPNAFVSGYLKNGDIAGYLRMPLSSQWVWRLGYLDRAVGTIADELKAKGVPLLLVYAPSEAQADIIAGDMKLPGIDAQALDRQVAVIAARHGAIFVDGAQAFHGVGNAPDYFYRADGHPNAEGQSLVGRAAARALITTPASGLCGESAG
jgi:hypothetical protein